MEILSGYTVLQSKSAKKSKISKSTLVHNNYDARCCVALRCVACSEHDTR